jgi:two-component sensor histidine kinase
MGTGFRAVAQRIDVEFANNIKSSLKKNIADTARINLLLMLGKYYADRYQVTLNKIEPDSSMMTLQKAIKFSIRISDDDRKIEGIRLMGETYLLLKDTTRASRCISATLGYLKMNRRFNQMISACISYGRAAYNAHYPAISEPYFERAMSIAVENHLKDRVLLIKSWILFGKGINGRNVLRDALRIVAEYKNNNENLDRIYYQLAQIYRYNGDIKTALKYALASVKDMDRFRDTAYVSYSYGELALTYDVLGEAEKSVYYYRKTLEARAKLAMGEEYKYRTLGFIVQNLFKLGRPKEALTEVINYEKAFPPQSDYGKAFCDQNKGFCYQALGDYEKAERFYLRLLKSPVMTLPNDISCLAYYDISRFYIKKKEYKAAKFYLKKSNCVTSAFDNLKNYEQLRYIIDSALNNYKSAMQHYANYQRAKDSLFNESTIKEISELQLKYETSKKEKDIALLKKDSQIQRNSLRQAAHVRNLTFGGIILLSLALLFLYSVLINNRKKSKVIDQKNLKLNHLLEEKDGLLDEKEWLIKEIHHRVKNNLQIVIGLLQRQSSYVDNDIALKAIQNSENRMHAIALIHQKLYQVDTLDQINTQEYINDLILHLQENADTDGNIVFVKNIEFILLDVAQAVPLGLILNEAITNAIKYAYPDGQNGKIYVEFKLLPEGFNLLTVRDEGVGFGRNFDMKTIKTMGINLMRGLSKQLGGAFNVNFDNGVVIEIKFKSEPVIAVQH